MTWEEMGARSVSPTGFFFCNVDRHPGWLLAQSGKFAIGYVSTPNPNDDDGDDDVGGSNERGEGKEDMGFERD